MAPLPLTLGSASLRGCVDWLMPNVRMLFWGEGVAAMMPVATGINGSGLQSRSPQPTTAPAALQAAERESTGWRAAQ